MNKFKNTIDLLYRVFNKEVISFLIIKAQDPTSNDVDVLIKYKDYNKAVRALRREGFKPKGSWLSKIIVLLGLDTPHYSKEGYLDIDLYNGMPWRELPVMDEKLLWDNPQFVEQNGVVFMIPNMEAEYLSIVANAIFTGSPLNMETKYYLSTLASDENFIAGKVCQQRIKYGWIGRRLHKQILKPLWIQIKRDPMSCLKAIGIIIHRCYLGRLYGKVFKTQREPTEVSLSVGDRKNNTCPFYKDI